MKRYQSNLLALAVGLVVMALPIAAAVRLAKNQAIREETRRAETIATEVLRRSDETGDQTLAAFGRLRTAKLDDPCSDAGIELMRKIDLASSYIQTVGRVEGDRLVCTSMGRHEPGLKLGPVGYVSSLNAKIRPSVQLSIAPGSSVLVAELEGFAVVVHQDLAVDVYPGEGGVSIGMYAVSAQKPIRSRGDYQPHWNGTLPLSTTGFDGKHAFAILRSKKFDYAAYAAVPAGYINARAQEAAVQTVPVGVLVGLLFALGLFFIARHRTSLPSLLRAGLRNNEFFLHYQPIVELASGRCIGAEALVRWRRPDNSLVRPELFIQEAEKSRQIVDITTRVFKLLHRDLPSLLAVCPDFKISVNLSAEDIRSNRLVNQLKALLATPGMNAGNLQVEITERGLLNTDESRQMVQSIRSLGVAVAIDDFGTGFSSLSYLTTFEVDALKIDKAFVETIGTGAATSHVADHIISMAQALNLEMIAEGVETAEQVRFLLGSRVQFAQGWHFAKAMSAHELIAYLGRPGGEVMR